MNIELEIPINYKIAIPSYDRVNILKENTLKMLHKQNINKENIYIFVANKEEYIKYNKEISNHLYNKIIIGERGLLNIIRFIKNYFEENENIVKIDDDVECIFKKRHSKKEPNITRKLISEIDVIDLDKLIIKGFKKLKELNLTLWGINKVANPFLMTDGYSTDLRCIVGTFYSFINKKDKKYDYKVSTPDNYILDDIENSLICYINDGGILRFNEYGFKALKIMSKGGIDSDLGSKEIRYEKIKIMNELVSKYYSDYGKIVPNKKQGSVFRLHRTPKVKKIKIKFYITKKNFYIKKK